MSDFCGADMGKERKRIVESSCLFTNNEDVMSTFQIESSDFLNDIAERSACPNCHKSRRYFCYTCYVPVDEVKDKIPCLKLPIKVDIIKHPREVEGKSTSAHAAILAPNDVRVFVYPDIPDYSKEEVLLVFPSKNASPLREWWKQKCKNEFHGVSHNNETQRVCDCHLDYNILNSCGQNTAACDKVLPVKEILSLTNCDAELCSDRSVDGEDKTKCVRHCQAKVSRKNPNNSAMDECELHTACCSKVEKTDSFSYPFDRVIFIDSTWKQTKRIYGDERIRCLPSVVLTSHKSLFWRHQRAKPENHLATIEAVYYFLVDLHNLAHPDNPYSGQYDNLLFFFKFMYNKIRHLYDPRTLRAYRDHNNHL